MNRRAKSAIKMPTCGHHAPYGKQWGSGLTKTLGALETASALPLGDYSPSFLGPSPGSPPERRPHPRGLFYSTDSDRDIWIFSYFHTVETEFLHKGLGSLYLLEEARTSWLEIKVRKSCCPAQRGGGGSG